MTFELPKQNKIFSLVSGIAIALFSTYRWIRPSGTLPDSIFTFVMSCLAIMQILKTWRARLTLDKKKLHYCDGYVSIHTIDTKQIAFIKVYRPTKLAVHDRNGEAFAIDFIFDNIEGFYEQVKKLKIPLDVNDAQRSKQIDLQ